MKIVLVVTARDVSQLYCEVYLRKSIVYSFLFILVANSVFGNLPQTLSSHKTGRLLVVGWDYALEIRSKISGYTAAQIFE